MSANTTGEAKKYDALHFFLDESGNFTRMRDCMLVGGVLIFGDYDRAVQDGLRKAMEGAMGEIGRAYPQDMHFCELCKENPRLARQFATALNERLDAWRKTTGTQAYGVLIQHQHDIHSESPGLLAEKELDNRYISLLWALIENIVFVNEKVSRRLSDDAAIHLHIARRAFTFRKDEAVRQLAESLRWQVYDDDYHPGNYRITSILSGPEIRGMFRVALHDRWANVGRSLASVDVAKMEYKPINRSAETTPAMYLADVVLGVERQRMPGLYYKNQVIAQSPLPMLEKLSYDHHLEALSRSKAALESDGENVLLSLLKEQPFDVNDPQCRGIVSSLVSYLQKSPEPFYSLWESALKKVDHPSHRHKGNLLAALLEAVYRKSGVRNLQCELYSVMIPFSAANHSGDTQRANALWRTYLELENELPSLGGEAGMAFQTEFRCRRAVSLTDQFRFLEAEKVLVEIGAKEDDFRGKMAVIFNTTVENINAYRLGMCYSTLGQACAFQSSRPERRGMAESLFRDALACFEKPLDQERVWVYLGHLACDFPEDGRALWEEVESHLPTFDGDNADGLDKPFVWALRLKEVLVFGDDEQKKQWLQRSAKMLKDCPQEVLAVHPFGLILQMLAMLAVSLKEEDEATRYFQQAEHSLGAGENLLQLLATISRLRHSLWLVQTHPGSEKKLARLEEDMTRCIELVAGNDKQYFLLEPGQSPVESASQILEKIRFNYW